MLVRANDFRLFVDVANVSLVPDGNRMQEKPTLLMLLMLHGGPGFDHTAFEEAFSSLNDIAQVVFYDHHGSGRSEGNDPALWSPGAGSQERSPR